MQYITYTSRFLRKLFGAPGPLLLACGDAVTVLLSTLPYAHGMVQSTDVRFFPPSHRRRYHSSFSQALMSRSTGLLSRGDSLLHRGQPTHATFEMLHDTHIPGAAPII